MQIRTKGEYYGLEMNELEAKGILLSEYQYNEPSTAWHYHENPYFMYTLQGKVTDFNKQRTTLSPAGSLLFHNWQELHYNSKENGFAKGFHIEFEREFFENYGIEFQLWEGSQIFKDPHLHQILHQIYFEFKQADIHSNSAIEILVLELADSLSNPFYKADKVAPKWVAKLREILDSNQEDVSLKSLSTLLDVHPVHLSRSIPKYFNSNLGDYTRKQKLAKALSLLMNPKFKLTEIAYEAGFTDQSHFIKCFKSVYHQSPNKFRRVLLS